MGYMQDWRQEDRGRGVELCACSGSCRRGRTVEGEGVWYLELVAAAKDGEEETASLFWSILEH